MKFSSKVTSITLLASISFGTHSILADYKETIALGVPIPLTGPFAADGEVGGAIKWSVN